jgi:DNA-binding NarL/FixJ family response regulator
MRLLIIDDSEYKIQSLQAVVKECLGGSETKVAKCFQTGVRVLNEFKPDLVLLDMSLPTSERSDGELEGRTRIFGGKDILAEMKFEGIKSKVVVVTQFDHFGEPPNSINLETLLSQLKNSFPELYAGGVYYSNVDASWREKLRAILQAIKQ